MTRAAWARLRAALVCPVTEGAVDACVVCVDIEGYDQLAAALVAYDNAALVQSALEALACIGLAVAIDAWGTGVEWAPRAAMLGLEEP